MLGREAVVQVDHHEAGGGELHGELPLTLGAAGEPAAPVYVQQDGKRAGALGRVDLGIGITAAGLTHDDVVALPDLGQIHVEVLEQLGPGRAPGHQVLHRRGARVLDGLPGNLGAPVPHVWMRHQRAS